MSMQKEIIKTPVTLDSLSVKMESIAESIGNLATKSELGRLEESIGKLATKEALDNLVVRVDALPTRKEMNDMIEKAVDELAEATGKGFAGVDKRFVEVDKRFDALEQKVDRMDTRLTNQLDYVLTHYTRREEHVLLDKRVKKVEARVFA